MTNISTIRKKIVFSYTFYYKCLSLGQYSLEIITLVVLITSAFSKNYYYQATNLYVLV